MYSFCCLLHVDFLLGFSSTLKMQATLFPKLRLDSTGQHDVVPHKKTFRFLLCDNLKSCVTLSLQYLCFSYTSHRLGEQGWMDGRLAVTLCSVYIYIYIYI
jgi:hypothetical protein